jgi:uncharacterized paraquat-inducible protein A
MISKVDWEYIGQNMLSLNLFCETMSVQIICTLEEFRLLQRQVDAVSKSGDWMETQKLHELEHPREVWVICKHCKNIDPVDYGKTIDARAICSKCGYATAMFKENCLVRDDGK